MSKSIKNFTFSLLPLKSQIGEYLISRVLENPILIVGSGRSGTTAMARALDQHSQVMFSANEAPFGSHLAQLAFDYHNGPVKSWYKENLALPENAIRNSLRQMFYESVWGENYGLRRNIGVFQGSLNRIKRARFWGTKAFPTEQGALGLDWVFPRMKYLYIIRDGIDVLNSMGKFGAFAEMSFVERCQFWKTTVERYGYLRKRNNAITIRFEEFVSNPHGVLEDVEKHIGLDAEIAPALFAESNLVHPLSEEGTRKAKPAIELKNRPPAWLQWTNAEKQIFIDECGSCMGKLGYEIPF